MSVCTFCIVLLCPCCCFAQDKICDRPDLQNGMFYSGANFPARKNADLWYDCNDNFDPVYKEKYSWYRGKYGKSTCTENGWNPMPKCVALCWPSDARVRNADIYHTKNQYKEEDRVRFKCYGDLRTEDGRNDGEIECLPNHNFSEARCLIGKSCDQPPDVENAFVVEMKPRYHHEDSAKYSCQAGYTSEDDQAKCLEGKWTNVPKCIYTSCESAPEINNAVLLDEKANYSSGERAVYMCNSGYVFNKDQNSTICKNSQWMELPECRKQGQSCESPPVVQFGDTLENREPTNKHGTVMNYKCPEYYILEGSKVVMCSHGKWDDPPICLEPCTVTERDLTANNIRLKWLSDKKLYTRHNEWIGFACLDGYEISDETMLRKQCYRGNLPFPKCIKKGSCLLSLTTMDEMHIFVNGSTEIEPGETVNFLCKEGWIPKDTLTQVCKNRIIKYPTCRSPDSCQISQEQLDRNELELDSKDKDSVYFEDGERIQFKCKAGFTITTGTVGLCTKSHVTYPKCTDADICRLCHAQLEENGLELDSKDTVYFEDGELIQFKCKTGFTISTGTLGLCAKTQITYPKCIKT